LNDFLLNNPDLSPSKIFQTSLYNLIEQRKNFSERIRIMEVKLQRAIRFIVSKELGEEYAQFKG
jgi:hypothetical protein